MVRISLSSWHYVDLHVASRKHGFSMIFYFNFYSKCRRIQSRITYVMSNCVNSTIARITFCCNPFKSKMNSCGQSRTNNIINIKAVTDASSLKYNPLSYLPPIPLITAETHLKIKDRGGIESKQ